MSEPPSSYANDGGCYRSYLATALLYSVTAASAAAASAAVAATAATAAAAASAAAAGVAVSCSVDAVSRRRHHRDRDGREILLHGYHLRSIWTGGQPSAYAYVRRVDRSSLRSPLGGAVAARVAAGVAT